MLICKYLDNKHPTKCSLWSAVKCQMKTSAFKVHERDQGMGGRQTASRERNGVTQPRDLTPRLFSNGPGGEDRNGGVPLLRTAPAARKGHPYAVWEARMGFIIPSRERRGEPRFG